MSKFALAKEHRFHFNSKGYLELEGLISLQQVEQLREVIHQRMSKKNIAPHAKWTFENIDARFLAGHDLWRDEEIIQKVALDKKFASIAAELCGEKLLRMGCDQLLFGENKSNNTTQSKSSIYESLLSKMLPLEEISCIRGVSCSALICLSSAEQQQEDLAAQEETFFPKVAGHVLFFTPKKTIPFCELMTRSNQIFLWIVYAEKTALYFFNDADPHVHYLKHLGYVFGDRLNDQLNPIVYR